MAKAKRQATARDILAELTGDPATITTICENVSEGESLTTLCKTWGVRFGAIMTWIRADKQRSKMYAEAKLDRREWLIEVVIQELKSLALSDLRLAFDDKGKMLHPKEWPDELAKAVAGLEVAEIFEGVGREREYVGDLKKLKLWDKKGSLELMGKHLAMYIEKHEHSVDKTLEELLDGSYGDEEGGDSESRAGDDTEEN